MIRSVLTCETKSGVCGKCYGRDLARGTRGQHRRGGRRHRRAVDRRAGHPAHHADLPHRRRRPARRRAVERRGGVRRQAADQATATSWSTAKACPIVMGRNCELVLIDEEGRERARHRIPYGAKLLADDGTVVTKGQKLAEWDPYTHPDHHRARRHRQLPRPGRGHVDARGDGRGDRHHPTVVIDWKQQPRGNDLKPRITLPTARARSLKLANGLEARYFMSVDAILSVENGAQVQGRRRAGPHPARILQDPRHHRRSAAGGGAVRGAQAQGLRHHQRDRRPGRIRQGLQDQAPDHRGPRGRRAASRSST